eukprot:8924743-Prorocentrum_lima.AAC.1
MRSSSTSRIPTKRTLGTGHGTTWGMTVALPLALHHGAPRKWPILRGTSLKAASHCEGQGA